MRKTRKIPKKKIEEIFLLTPLQEGILYHYLKGKGEEGEDLYMEQLSLTISGFIDIEVFKKAWKKVVESNGMLRTCFRWEKLKNPMQFNLKSDEESNEVDIKIMDLSGNGDEVGEGKFGVDQKLDGYSVSLMDEFREQDVKRGFDLREVPFRIILCKKGPDLYEMIVSNHHILYDGWSNGIILREFFDAYHHLLLGKKIRGRVKPRFKEFVNALHEQDKGLQKAFWGSYLEGLDSRTQLRVKRETSGFGEPEGVVGSGRPDGSDGSGGTYGFVQVREVLGGVEVSGPLYEKIDQFCRERKVTLSSLLYTAWGILLQKYNFSRDVVFGTTVSGRNVGVKEVEETVGLFINTIPLRFITEPAETVDKVVKQVDDHLRKRKEFENFPLVEIQSNVGLMGNEALFDTLLVVENYPLGKDLTPEGSRLQVNSYRVTERTNYDLTVCINVNEGIEITFIYNSPMFSKTVVCGLSEHYLGILDFLVENPGIEASQVELVKGIEREKILTEFNRESSVGIMGFKKGEFLCQLLEEQVFKTPDNVAIVDSCCWTAISYDEFNRDTEGMAWGLRNRGIGSGMIVPLIMERSPMMVMAVWAVVKAGGVYLPIDPNTPLSRVAYILKDIEARHLLFKRDSVGNKKEWEGANEITSIEPGIEKIDLEKMLGRDVDMKGGVSLSDTMGKEPEPNLYIIYTSGSTGNPKGVLVGQEGVIHLLKVLHQEYPLKERDAYLLKTSYVFDVSVTELFGWFWEGARLVVMEKNGEGDPGAIIDNIEKNKVTHINFVPTMFGVFGEYLQNKKIRQLFKLKYIFLAGEKLVPSIVRAFDQLKVPVKLENLYGPTEASVYASRYSLSLCSSSSSKENGGDIPIGKPLEGLRLYVLDQDLKCVPVGVLGELYVAGEGVARGYVNNLEMSARVFGLNPFAGNGQKQGNQERLYRTGDLARWLPDGNIEYIGRRDYQVKVRGFRIELGEIEKILVHHPGIKEVVVDLKQRDGDTYLCAYLVPLQRINEGLLENQGHREYLSGILPEYMIPSSFVLMEKIPLLPSGKVDRRALPEPAESISGNISMSKKEVPGTNIEKIIAEIWAQVLHLEKDQVAVDKNFNDLGGHSLHLLRIQSRLEEALQRDIPVVVLFNNPTIRTLARYLNQDKTKEKSRNLNGKIIKETELETLPESKSDRSTESFFNRMEIAVIGMSCRFPGAKNIGEFWENLKNGIESITFFTEKELEEMGVDPQMVADPNYVPAKGILEGKEYFDHGFFDYTPAEAEMMDPQSRIFHECCWEALEMAGYNPFRYNRSIGLYAGATANPWWGISPLMSDTKSVAEKWGEFQYSDKDFIVTRIAYKLDLKGPSVSLHTACSTSLVAIDMACQGILTERCQMALAGGVSITSHDEKGYQFQKGMIMSADGHCRAFDADAGGIVSGNGVGVVLLKELQEAIEDGDTIHAVIKGSFISNDGIRKIGYTAPGLKGQVQAIRSAMRIGKVEPESITYVEAHGTGTPLGDPIEVEALIQAFESSVRQFCGIGSVKTNIGHLDAAAGVAGFIKTVLALKNREIPPSLNYSAPNPKIEFEKSPFYVVKALKPWGNGSNPLRAGVSSFGIGGTNAHVILEEAPAHPTALKVGGAGCGPDRQPDINHGKGEPRVHPEPEKEPQLILLSARTPTALDKLTLELVEYLKKKPDTDLKDLAYTLKVGRREFQYRRAQVCTLTDELIKDLTSSISTKGPLALCKNTNRPVYLMFPGQGSQYLKMAWDLYLQQPFFRQEVDTCFEILEQLDDWNPGMRARELLYPFRNIESRKAHFQDLVKREQLKEVVPDSLLVPNEFIEKAVRIGEVDVGDLINQTRFTQPLLFVVEHALARLLMELGVMPKGLVGHSIGEYTAACLSGVLSLEDALAVVVMRGKFMQEAPYGRMLGVALPPRELADYLKDGLSIAAVNTQTGCVISGPAEKVDAAEKELKKKGIPCRALHTSHAFHSQLMDPAKERFREYLETVTLNKPQIPFISNVTGKWITEQEAMDPEYWAMHLRSAVLFYQGLEEMFQEESQAIFLEVGPGKTLTTFARQHSRKETSHLILNLQRHPKEKVPDHQFFLEQLGKAWAKGLDVEWKPLYMGQKRHRIPIPTYPFEKIPFRVDPLEGNAETSLSLSAGYISSQDLVETSQQQKQGKQEILLEEPLKDSLTSGKHHHRPDLSSLYVFPSNTIQSRMAEIWQHYFGFETIGIKDDFFELGGDSLKAVSLGLLIQKAFGKEIPVSEFFRNPTIAGLSKYISGTESSSDLLGQGVLAIEEKEYYPLSSAQRRLYVLQHMEEINTAYHISTVLIWKGTVNLEKLQSVLSGLIKRHSSFRTSFHVIHGKPVQRIHKEVPFKLEMYQESKELPGEIHNDSGMGVKKTLGNFIQPYDLKKLPLLKIGFLLREQGHHLFMIDMHHIISDGISIEIFVRELLELYSDRNPSPIPIRYHDYAHWEKQRDKGKTWEGSKEEAFWLEELKELPVLNILGDYPRPALQSFEGSSLYFEITDPELIGLRQFLYSGGVTLFMVLFAIFNIFLSRISRSSDIIVGTPVGGRHHANLEGVIGMFVNMLGLRSQPDPGKAFSGFLSELRDKTLKAFDNQDYPYEKLVEKIKMERDPSRNPLFDVVFGFQKLDEKPFENQSLQLQTFEQESSTSKFDLTLQGWETEGKVLFYFEYRNKIFRKDTIERFIRFFRQIVSEVISRPEIQLQEIEMVPEEDKNQVLWQFNQNPKEESEKKPVHQLFRRQALKTPYMICVAEPGHRIFLDYRELENRSHQLAGNLRKMGEGKDYIVGLMPFPSIEMVVGLLGILKSGAAFLPMDYQQPASRVAFMMKDSGATILLAHGSVIASLKSELKQCDLWDLSDKNLYNSKGQDFEIQSGASDLAYIIYTSGSSGKPKGVMIEHRSLSNLCCWHNQQYSVTYGDRAAKFAGFGFDASVWEIFPYIIAGASIFMVEELLKSDVYGLIQFFRDHRISIAFLPTQIAEQFMKQDNHFLRILLTGGDKLKSFSRNKYKLYNNYGPTECTVVSTYYLVTGPMENIPIGKPILNSGIYILDDGNHLLPVGIPGELCIAGIGIARGYLNNQSLSRRQFIKSPFRQNEWIYKTGDLARWLIDGNIEFLGRLDSQVKIRGFRIELGEIEHLLMSYKGIQQAVVVDRVDPAGEKYLCAYLVPGSTPRPEDQLQGDLKEQELLVYISRNLPDYMVPARFMRMEQIPMTLSGKVDRSKLPEPIVKPTSSYVAPRYKVEKELARIWAEVLFRKDPIGIDDHFFELGGHSLRATSLIGLIHKELGVRLPLAEIFKSPTIRKLSCLIDKGERELREICSKPKPQQVGKEYYPLSSAQRRLFFLDQLEEVGTSYNISSTFKVFGKFQKKELERIFLRLIQRHEVLRTSFEFRDNQPIQRIWNEDTIDFNITDLHPDKCLGDYQIREEVHKFIQPFNLSSIPLLRIGFADLGERQSLIVFDMHHIVSDGTSMGLLVNEFLTLYKGEELEPLTLQYRDFACWQKDLIESGILKDQENYWLNQFSKQIPRVNIPVDYKRPPVFTFEGDCIELRLNSEQTTGLRRMGIENEATQYMNLLAVLNVLLFKYTGQEEIVVGCGIAGRNHADLQNLIGMFVNTLALINSPSGDKTFRELLKEVKENSIKAFENQDIQFEELVDQLKLERDPSRNPLFDITIVNQNFERPEIEIEKVRFLPFEFAHRTSKFDITLFTFERGDNLHLQLEYYTPIFKKETILRFVNHFLEVIDQIIREPEITLSEIDVLTTEEKQFIVENFNQTESSYPKEKPIHVLFQEQVKQNPQQRGVIYKDEHLTYQCLEDKSNQVSNYLYYSVGIRTDELVGILLEKSVERIVTIWGILKARAGFVPLNPSLPRNRLRKMIQNASIGIVISHEKQINTLNHLQWECPTLHTIMCVDKWDIYSYRGEKENELMDEKLWEYVGENAENDITGGGWLSSYTGQPIPQEEMEEYGENVLKKLLPYLHPGTRVLEVGCATGLTMYRIALLAGYYCGTDLSRVIIKKNKERTRKAAIKNIRLETLKAHEIDQLEENEFDLIIINSVIQCFHGHNYLRQVLKKAVNLLKNQGYLFVGDVMDLDLKKVLIRDLLEYKTTHQQDKDIQTKTDFSEELFLSRQFFEDQRYEIPGIREIEFSSKIHTIKNELTRFRYDTLVKVDKSQGKRLIPGKKHKYQQGKRDLQQYPEKKQIPETFDGDNLGYVIYTSGTTGIPKGVLVSQAALVNLCYWHNRNFAVTRMDRATQYAEFGFDASVWEVFPYLIKGASLHFIPDEMKLEISRILDFYEREKITISFLPTQLCQQMMKQVKQEAQTSCLRILLTGGDKLNSFSRSTFQLYNNYGPTENTVVTTSILVEGDFDNIPIGRPIHNNKVLILGKGGRKIQPIGIPGEIGIIGDSLSIGYANEPEYTQAKFVKNPLKEDQEMYLTGDLGRWKSDGNIEFLGRVDQQVKIRGFRIELGEIEAQLNAYGAFREVAVIDLEDAPGDTFLCACLVCEDTIEVEELRKQLLTDLPDYMVPRFIVQVENIPLNPNGKVDRKALPIVNQGNIPGDFQPPQDEIEEKLVEIWADILGINRELISATSDFFESGGHSLKATMMKSAIKQQYQVDIPLAEIFKTPSIIGISSFIRGIIGTSDIQSSRLELMEDKEYYPLSSAQKRLFIMQKMKKQNISYNIPVFLELEGELDLEKLNAVFSKLLERHECLRTSFQLVEGEPVQRIQREVCFQVENDQFLGQENLKQGSEQFIRPFILEETPLFRVGLIRKNNQEHLLMVDMHHIISDGTSIGNLVREFMNLYEGKRLPGLRSRYRDFSQSQILMHKEEKESQEKQERYWMEVFEEEVPVLELPTDYPRLSKNDYKGNSIRFEIGKRETESLKELTHQKETTLYMLLLSIFNVLLFKISGQEDFAIGVPSAGRKSPEFQEIIGMFVNTLGIRFNPTGGKTFEQFLDEITRRTLEAFENQDFQFDDLVEKLALERRGNRNPLFDVMFVFQNMEIPELEIPGLKLRVYDYESHTSKFDITLDGSEIEGTLYFRVEYSTSLFRIETILRFIKYFKKLVSGVIQDPGIFISEMTVIGEKEKSDIMAFSRGKREHLEKNKTIHGNFEQVVGSCGNKIALEFKGKEMSYKDLNERSNPLAWCLRSKGVARDTIVGLMVERSFEMIIGMLGILKAGAAYLPLDVEYPTDRIRYMIQDSGITLLLTNLKKEEIQSVINNNIEVIYMEQHTCTQEPGGFPDGRRGSAQSPVHPLFSGSFPEENPKIINKEEDLVYIIYTSGSTGKPKGVMIEHRNVVNLIEYQKKYTKLETFNTLQFATINFDASFHEIFATLLTGGKLHLIEKELRTNIPSLLKYIGEKEIKTLFLPISFLRMVFNDPGYSILFPPDVTHIQTAGEQVVVSRELRNYLRENHIHFHNHYGPSETHVVTTLTMEPKGDIPDLPTIGKPIINTDIYILDKQKNDQPIGVPGELYIGGIQVGRGYLGMPQLTEEKFVNLFALSSTKMYRTGDLARWTRDGNIEFLGRIDHQVKIRGFRVEPGEIESHLLSHSQVKDAVVITLKSEAVINRGEIYLCAYIVMDKEHQEAFEESELREYLSQTLPDYMVPSYIIPIEEIPITSNGKVNRRALPANKEGKGQNEHIAPKGFIEKKLVSLWAELLGREKESISVQDNFFHLGGHSLKGIMLVSRILQELNLEMPFSEIFNNPDIRKMSIYLKAQSKTNKRKKQKYESITNAEKKEYYPLSSSQKRLYMLQQMETGSIAYNMPYTVKFKGVLEVEKFKKIISELTLRHEALRTSFPLVKEKPVQRIATENIVQVDYVGLEKGNPDLQKTEEKQVQHILQEKIQPFELQSSPLFRILLIKVAKDQHVMIADMHHIISDGTSMGILVKDFMILYSGVDLPPLRIQYKDYSEWRKGYVENHGMKKQEAWWMEQYRGEIPVLKLRTDFARPTYSSFEGRLLHFNLGEAETRALKQFVSNEKITLFMGLMALFNVFLSKISAQEDIIVGTPVEGRYHHETRSIMGVFINTLALRNFPMGHQTFREFLAEVKEKSLEAFENQEYPFEDLVEKVMKERDPSRHALFDVLFVLQNMEISRFEVPGLQLEPVDYSSRISKFDLTLQAVETRNNLNLSLEYCSQLFKESTIRRYICYIKELVLSVLKNPDAPLSLMEIIPKHEKQRILEEFNNNTLDFETSHTLPEIFETHVKRQQNILSVVYEDNKITYKELNLRSRHLSEKLRQMSVAEGDVVSLILDPSVEMILGIIAVLQAGGAYLPIAEDHPMARKQFILEDSETVALITLPLPRLHEGLQEGDRQLYQAIPSIPVIRVGKENSHLLEKKNIPRKKVIRENIKTRPESPAYIIYTSGTTGKPKGVKVSHRNVNNLVKGLEQRIYKKHISQQKKLRVCLIAPYVFDASVQQVFGALLQGHTLQIVPVETRKDGHRLMEYYQRNRTDISDGTPTHLHLINEAGKGLREIKNIEPVMRVKEFIIGGEALPGKEIREFYKVFESATTIITNVYGPTECCVDSTSFEIKREQIKGNEKIPIGKPMPNEYIYIIDKAIHLQPIGIAGELCIGGEGVSLGYVKRGNLMKDAFIPNPFNLGGKIYRTGDLAAWRSDGNIEFIGREDQQVKIRGFRIELEEIQNQLLEHPEVRKAMVIEREDQNGNHYLCSYVVKKSLEDEKPSVEELREFLMGHLPGYMIPSYFVFLEEIPVTPSGKVDRQALPEPQVKAGDINVYEAPGDYLESQLVVMWAEILGTERENIGIDDDFFKLGGHSLKATILINRIHRELEVKLELGKIFKNNTIRAMAELIKQSGQQEYEIIRISEKKEYYLLSPAQKRLYIQGQLENQSISYNIYAAVLLQGELEIKRIETTFKKLIGRHESFRTSFELVEDIPVQRVYPGVYFQVQQYSIDEEPGLEPGVITRKFISSFDLSKAPLLRVGIIRKNLNEHILILDMHHIISDGTSMGILVEEFMALYSGEELPCIRIQYRDYTQWLLSGEDKRKTLYEMQENYWLKEFETGVPVLEIPIDFPRPEVLSFEGHSITFELGKMKTAQLKEMALKEDITIFMFLLTIFNILLSRLSGQESIVVGTPIANRVHEDLHHLIGMCVNTLLLKTELSGETEFKGLLKKVKEKTLKAFENQAYQFEDLVNALDLERDPGRNALFDVMFVFQNMEIPELQIKGLTLKPYEIKNQVAQFDLILIGNEVKGQVYFTLIYKTALFTKDTIDRYMNYFLEILDMVLGSDNLNLKLDHIIVSHDLKESEVTVLDEALGDFEF
jgi:amino acid adenylation domain-containing protein